MHDRPEAARKLERSESQKPGLSREQLENQFGAGHKLIDSNYSAFAQVKHRPASSYRTLSSKRGSAAPTYGGVTKIEVSFDEAN